MTKKRTYLHCIVGVTRRIPVQQLPAYIDRYAPNLRLWQTATSLSDTGSFTAGVQVTAFSGACGHCGLGARRVDRMFDGLTFHVTVRSDCGIAGMSMLPKLMGNVTSARLTDIPLALYTATACSKRPQVCILCLTGQAFHLVLLLDDTCTPFASSKIQTLV